MQRKRRIGSSIFMILTLNLLTSSFLLSLIIPPANSDEIGITGDGPVASDTVITKNWEALETYESWWNVNWQYRKHIILTEPGLMDRDKDPVDVYVTFSGDVAHENSIRIAYYDNSSTWNEI
ncbi:MAG: hypothetical protein ACTSUE_05375, partial [Promethearchaeota archaeon]